MVADLSTKAAGLLASGVFKVSMGQGRGQGGQERGGDRQRLPRSRGDADRN